MNALRRLQAGHARSLTAAAAEPAASPAQSANAAASVAPGPSATRGSGSLPLDSHGMVVIPEPPHPPAIGRAPAATASVLQRSRNRRLTDGAAAAVVRMTRDDLALGASIRPAFDALAHTLATPTNRRQRLIALATFGTSVRAALQAGEQLGDFEGSDLITRFAPLRAWINRPDAPVLDLGGDD